jgi:hypothetical protein
MANIDRSDDIASAPPANNSFTPEARTALQRKTRLIVTTKRRFAADLSGANPKRG